MKFRDPSDTPKYRKTVTLRDQHERPWECILDQESMAPCALPIPKFSAPLEVPLVYVQPARDLTGAEQAIGEVIPGRLAIDYDRWEQDWSEADRAHQRLRVQVAADKKWAPDHPDLDEILGEAPQSVEFVRAARAGNRWVLGLPSLRTGAPLPVPPFAVGLLDRLAPRDVRRIAERDVAVDASRYADAEDEAPALAAVGADDAYGDVEDAHDPDALGGARIPTTSRRRTSARV